MNMFDLLLSGVFALMAVVFFMLFNKLKKYLSKIKDSSGINTTKKMRNLSILLLIIALLFAWLCSGYFISALPWGVKHEEFTVEIFAPMVQIGSVGVSSAALWGSGVTLMLTVLCLMFRIFVVPRFTQIPKGLQNLFELMVESVENFTLSTLHSTLGPNLMAYMIALPMFLVGCAAIELFGIRSPTSDLTTTFALAMVTFFLINYYGLREKGVSGRFKDFTSPSPVILPIKIITDCAIPVSMACRLFGNMLAGVIIVELLYYALGNLAVGIPAIFGLYFNLFHPLIQAFIFMTLTLSFIGEAVEEPEGRKKSKKFAKARAKNAPENADVIPVATLINNKKL